MRDRLRIVVVSGAKVLTDHLPHGEGLIVFNHLAALASRGHEITVFTGRAEIRGGAPFEVVELGHVLPSGGLDPLVHGVRAALRVRRRAFDVAHWMRPLDQETMLFPLSSLLALPRDLPYFVGPFAKPWSRDLESMRFGASERLLSQVSRRSHPVQRRLLGRGVVALLATPDAAEATPEPWQARTAYVPLGVDADVFRPSPLPDRPRALFMGTLTRYKGVPELIEAFARVAGQDQEAELWLAGEGPLRPELERAAVDLGLAERVRFLGARPHAETAALLADASLLVLPSHGEPFGMAVLEAMASGRAVVAVNAGGPRTLVHHGRGGELVPAERPDELARSILRLLSSRDRLAGMGRYNRSLVERQYTLPRVAARLEELYLQALGRNDPDVGV